MRRIEVLHLRDTYDIGGPGKTILETHRAIDPERFGLTLGVFLTRRESEDTPFVRAAAAAGLAVEFTRVFNQYDPRAISQTARLIKARQIDVVHTHEIRSDVIGYLATRLRRVPIVTTLHGWISHSARHRLLIALDKRVVRHFDAVIAVSSEIRREALAAGVAPQAAHLLHNAIVAERYQWSGRSGFLSRLVGRPLDRPIVVSLGRLSPEKGHADLVEALALVARRGHKVSAVLAGDGPERLGLIERVRALGLGDSVHLPGHTDLPVDVLGDADLMVLPSHTEGLPNVVLEALAMRLPVLATAVGGTPEIITDGETGRLVAAHAPEALATAIVDFVLHPVRWQQSAASGERLVRSQFTFRARTLKLEEIYIRLCARRPHAG